jgi:cytoskeleton protein RodZ
VTEKKNETSFSITPGQLLSAAREARSLSQSDIAKQTCLSVQSINELEHDNYAQIGARTFVRGYLCSYARLVNVSEKQILDALDASGLMPADTYSVLPRIEGAPVMDVTHQQSRQFKKSNWIVVGAVSVLALVTLFLFMHHSKNDAVKNQAAAKAVSAQSVSLPQAQTQPAIAPPSVAISQPVIISTPSVKKENKKLVEKTEKTKNGFVVKPNVALHTTYTIKPAD